MADGRSRPRLICLPDADRLNQRVLALPAVRAPWIDRRSRYASAAGRAQPGEGTWAGAAGQRHLGGRSRATAFGRAQPGNGIRARAPGRAQPGEGTWAGVAGQRHPGEGTRAGAAGRVSWQPDPTPGELSKYAFFKSFDCGYRPGCAMALLACLARTEPHRRAEVAAATLPRATAVPPRCSSVLGSHYSRSAPLLPRATAVPPCCSSVLGSYCSNSPLLLLKSFGQAKLPQLMASAR
jgi:hypothetical protein